MAEVQAEMTIPAPLAQVWESAKDVERFPEFLPNVEQVTVREKDGARLVTDWVGLVPEFKRTIKWTEEDEWDDDAHVCRFRALEGDWDKYQGEWSFAEEDGGTRARLRIEYEYNVPLIGPLIRKLLHKLVQRNAQETLDGLRRRAMGEI